MAQAKITYSDTANDLSISPSCFHKGGSLLPEKTKYSNPFR